MLGEQTFAQRLATLTESARYDVEERAAIMEYDGGLSRGLAEQAAWSWWLERVEAAGKAGE